MRLSLLFELQRPAGPDYDQLVVTEAVEQIVAAEQAGFHTAWLTEHHFLPTFSNSPCQDLVLAAVSQRTKRIRLGLGAIILPYHHPVQVAERVAMLDILSGGRVEFGTGRGGPFEQVGMGIDPREGRARWDESLQIITQIWQTEGEFSFDGQFWQVPPRTVLPRPVQLPHPPLWLACTSKESYRIAAEKGLGVLEFESHPPASLVPDAQAYRESVVKAEPVGAFTNNQWASCCAGFCGDDGKAQTKGVEIAKSMFGPGRPYAAASAGLFAALLDQWGDEAPEDLKVKFERSRAGLDLSGSGTDDGKQSLWDKVPARVLSENGTIVAGNPEQCLAGLEHHRQLGSDEVMLIMQTDAVTHLEAMRSIEMFGSHIIPKVSTWTPELMVTG